MSVPSLGMPQRDGAKLGAANLQSLYPLRNVRFFERLFFAIHYAISVPIDDRVH